MVLNIDNVQSEFELLNNVKDKSLAFNEIFEDINKQNEMLLAKKHLFAVLFIAETIDKLMIDSGVKSEDIESIVFSEHEYTNDHYSLSISIEPSVNSEFDRIHTLESDINDQMYILGEPKFFFFSDLASDQIDDFEYFEVSKIVGQVGNSFIKMSLNADLLNLYEKISFKNSLENSLAKDQKNTSKLYKM